MGARASKRSRPKQHGNPGRMLTRSTEHIPIYVDPQTQTRSYISPGQADTRNGDGIVPQTQLINQPQRHTRAESVSVYTDWESISPTRMSVTHRSNTRHNEATRANQSQTADISTTDNSVALRHDVNEDGHYDIIEDLQSHEINYSKEGKTDETNVRFPDDSSVNKLDIYYSIEDATVIPNEEETAEIKDRRRCKYYEYMVNVFRPLIVNNLIVHDVLPYLTFLEDEGAISAAEQRSPQQAVMYLLEEMQKSKELRKWKRFMTALEQSGYEYIVQNIRGTHTINNRYQVYYLRTLRAKLSRMIRPREILPRLCAEDIITDNTRQEIEQEETNHGRISAALLLLDRIPRKGTFWYRKFVQVLRDENIDEVADNLEIPEVMNCTPQLFKSASAQHSYDKSKSTDSAEETTDTYRPSVSSGEVSIPVSPFSMHHPSSKTTTTNSTSDPLSVDVITTSQPKGTYRVIESAQHETRCSFETQNSASVINNTCVGMRSDRDEAEALYEEPDIYEEPDSLGQYPPTPLFIGPPVPPPPFINIKTKRPENILQNVKNHGCKSSRNSDLFTTGSSAESVHESVAIDSVDMHYTHTNTINIPVDYGLQQILQNNEACPEIVKPEFRSAEVQVDIRESSPQTPTSKDYLEHYADINHSATNNLFDKKENVRINDTSSVLIDQYEELYTDEELYKDHDTHTNTTKNKINITHYSDKHKTLSNEVKEIMTENEHLKQEVELLRQKCSVTKERENLLRTKCELQKELEGTDTEYQSLKQSLLRPPKKEVQEAETLEAEYELDKLYIEKTNHRFSVVSGPFRKTGFSSERIRRRPSINDWRRTAMRKISAGFSDRLFQSELDFIDEPMQPTEIVKLCDFSTTKMANHPAFSDVDSAVFSDFSAYNISEAQ